MTATPTTTSPARPIIDGARLVAAHDGVVELLVTIAYSNGGKSEVTLDSAATDALLRSCDANEVNELLGHSWEKVRDALSHSYNRFR